MSEESLRWCWLVYPFKPKLTLANRMPSDVWIDRQPIAGANLSLSATKLPAAGEQFRVAWALGPFQNSLVGISLLYVPTVEYLSLVRDLFPEADPENPPWLKVEAELSSAIRQNVSHDKVRDALAELRRATAFSLLKDLKASRKQPESESTPNTFGRLLDDLGNHDATRRLANRTGAKATGPLVVGSASANYVIAGAMYHADADNVWTAIKVRPGVGRIQGICEAETGRFDTEAMKLIRGRLCVSLKVEPSAVDAMGLEQFADAWRERTAGRIPASTTQKPNRSKPQRRKGVPISVIQQEAKEYLSRHPWPGQNQLAEKLNVENPRMSEAVNCDDELLAIRSEAESQQLESRARRGSKERQGADCVWESATSKTHAPELGVEFADVSPLERLRAICTDEQKANLEAELENATPERRLEIQRMAAEHFTDATTKEAIDPRTGRPRKRRIAGKRKPR